MEKKRVCGGEGYMPSNHFWLIERWPEFQFSIKWATSWSLQNSPVHKTLYASRANLLLQKGTLSSLLGKGPYFSSNVYFEIWYLRCPLKFYLQFFFIVIILLWGRLSGGFNWTIFIIFPSVFHWLLKSSFLSSLWFFVWSCY